MHRMSVPLDPNSGQPLGNDGDNSNFHTASTPSHHGHGHRGHGGSGGLVDSRPVVHDHEGMFEESQELHPPEPCHKELFDWCLLAARCSVLLLFLVAFVLVLVNVCRGTRLKNWRLYCVVSLCIFLWLSMGLYLDHVDECVHLIDVAPQRMSIYWCFRNLLHGLSLYLCLLLLSHLSDFQHRGVWLWLVGAVVFVPLLVTIAILVIDLRLPPGAEGRYSWKWNVGIDGAKLLFYNVLNAILLIAFSCRFCTGRLYGTYSERRSTLTVTVSRWTFAFLLLHNLCAAGSFAATVCARTLTEGWEEAADAHRMLDEVALLLIVLCVPASYLVGAMGQRCCGARSEAELEMEKMDKIYQEVWTTNQAMKKQRHNGGPIINTHPEGGDSNPNRTNGSAASSVAGGGSNTSLNSNPNGGGGPSTATAGQRTMNPNGSMLNGSRASSIVTLQASPGSNRRDNPSVLKTPEKRRNRESYFEAVSMGSLQDVQGASGVRLSPAGAPAAGGKNRGDRASVTSEPIDL